MLVVMLGCGGGSPSAPVAGFLNRTKHTDTELWAIWKTAQQSVAASIDVNPLQTATLGIPPKILAGDERALNILPHGLLVALEADVSSSALRAATGENRPDPTGLIPCPQPCNVKFAPAYSKYRPDSSEYAASWEFNGNSFNLLLEYEFENQILYALGYDMSWR